MLPDQTAKTLLAVNMQLTNENQILEEIEEEIEKEQVLIKKAATTHKSQKIIITTIITIVTKNQIPRLV